MDKITLGTSGVEVSALCYGTDLIGSRVNESDSHRLLDAFASHGGTFIDTGNFYASWYPGCVGGESEATIGRWMAARGNRSRMVISTKLGFDYPGCEGGLNAREIERECEKSLKRLQTDYIDVYYAHRDDFDTPQHETMEAFHRLVSAGKVRAIGASNLWLWRVAEANEIARQHGLTPYSVVEQRYTYLRPRHGADFGPQICITDDMKRFCAHHNMTLIAYSILLQGAYTREDRPVPAQFAGPEADERMAALSQVAGETGHTLSQVIIAWMRQSDPPVLPIIGGSRTQQVEENIGALALTLSADQMERLTRAGDPNVKKAWLR
ncbi:MAG: aldo/keto reductase [Bacteroidota bacterium]|nr:aldo/keto reductase [Bacteroidota bacterium]